MLVCISCNICCHRLTFTRLESRTIHRLLLSSDFVTRAVDEKKEVIMICFAVKQYRQSIVKTDMAAVIHALATVRQNYYSVLKQNYRP